MVVEVRRTGAIPDDVERILRDLPDWFGIESSLLGYVEAARRLPTYAAFDGEQVVGVCLVEQHSSATAEIELIAVLRDHHRQGVGRRLMAAVSNDLGTAGMRFLQVKTLGRSEVSEEYDRTRRFYEAEGFVDLEEFAEGDLWPHHACLVMVTSLGEGTAPR
jgi:ribosomal protein S18 acetylase RimI-like enzyme